MSTQPFICSRCGSSFTVKPEVLTRYPGWTPQVCLKCRDSSKSGSARSSSRSSGATPRRAARAPFKKSGSQEQNLPVEKVLQQFTAGPFDGLFTDGACSGNPGPGGWGVVHVRDNEVVAQRHGQAEHTTNNRMELTALINAYEMLPGDAREVIWSDSNLCVRTLNEWAAGWKRRGWKRKKGPVENLELVRRAYELAQSHPHVELRWIKAHNGSRWNEYADALATAFLRDEV